ncbi:GNAT family N-acetyltransferase [Fictibacillus arsenicus]|uniref:GNAT family N-acetyltransferase n=1 Tax=Fictibacillus arsenicus TaxID=255247 RepID=A0A1V3G8J9_9BACL|nr:N-acetyltransferase [Fictibacillus arsenicus]OOE12744.1 GNAT family N-acetyltransferase [Fictibacillus arsenicus]
MIRIRTERNGDQKAITQINDLAFKGDNESRLVNAIRNSDLFVPELSLVAESDGELIGHILFSIVHIKSGKDEIPTLALAPMAVVPEHQNRGVGSLLVEEGLKRAKDQGFENVVVLGHPEFYPKFGFIPASTKEIEAPFPVPDEVFMALEIKEGSLDQIKGKIVYPPAFDTVS